MWTKFWDMHSGGSQKEKWAVIFIQSNSEDEAKLIFYNKFNHNPERVSCTCCGGDYSISSDDSLEQLTAYHRNCKYDNTLKKYIEAHNDEYSISNEDNYLTLEEYKNTDDVLILSSEDINGDEKNGEIPMQGYVWF